MKALKLQFLDNYRDIGLLVMRVGLGIAFIMHGWPKMAGGPEAWAGYGARMAAATGVNFAPHFWGFMAAFAELGGGILLVLGLLARPAAFLMLCTMIVAFLWHHSNGDDFKVYSHALEAAFTFFGLLFVGPGKYSVDANLK